MSKSKQTTKAAQTPEEAAYAMADRLAKLARKSASEVRQARDAARTARDAGDRRAAKRARKDARHWAGLVRDDAMRAHGACAVVSGLDCEPHPDAAKALSDANLWLTEAEEAYRDLVMGTAGSTQAVAD